MIHSKFPYQSVQHYLSVVLLPHSKPKDIIEAKKQYWKMYNTFLQRSIRKRTTTLHFKLEKAEANLLAKRVKNSGLSTFQYIKSVSLHGTPAPMMHSKLLREIEAEVLELLDNLNDLNEAKPDINLSTITTQVEKVDEHIQNLLNQIPC